MWVGGGLPATLRDMEKGIQLVWRIRSGYSEGLSVGSLGAAVRAPNYTVRQGQHGGHGTSWRCLISH